jgi:hypothetical protein
MSSAKLAHMPLREGRLTTTNACIGIISLALGTGERDKGLGGYSTIIIRRVFTNVPARKV